jgi:hypothetical protein
MAKHPANVSAPKFGEDEPRTREPRATTGPGTFRVSLEGVRVRVKLDENQPGGPRYLDSLILDAEDEADAIAKFAAYNGIPMLTDALTGASRMASVHQPAVVRVEAGAEDTTTTTSSSTTTTTPTTTLDPGARGAKRHW